MKKTFLILIYFVVMAFCSKAQDAGKILFSIGDQKVYASEVYKVLYPMKKNVRLTNEEFNRVLNFYLTIYDVKAKGEDTTKVFKRRIERYMIGVLGVVYGAKNRKNILQKYMVYPNNFGLVDYLFVPFDPDVLRGIEKRRREGMSFKNIKKFAGKFEGTNYGTSLIIPTGALWLKNRFILGFMGNKNYQLNGPIKDLKGYYYLKLIMVKDNFGSIKTKLIYVSKKNNGRLKIKEASKLLDFGVSFDEVAKKYSEYYKNDSLYNSVFVPSIGVTDVMERQLKLLNKDGDISKPFFDNKGWYIVKRIAKGKYPNKEELESNVLENIRKLSFFIAELKDKYKVKEYPYNFLNGKNDILFNMDKKSYYSSDLEQYANEYGYEITMTETYDRFLNHILINRYSKELDKKRYQRLVDDFYFSQWQTPSMIYEKSMNKKIFLKKLRKLINKYKPVIVDSKYVEDNPAFQSK